VQILQFIFLVFVDFSGLFLVNFLSIISKSIFFHLVKNPDISQKY